MYPSPPSRETLQAALHVFIEIYANRHLELDEIDRCHVFSDPEPLIAALEVVNLLIMPWTPDIEDEEEAWIEGEMPSIHWDS
jgi:hypothetical protein